jgi:multidrug efflux system membrane fusion protein
VVETGATDGEKIAVTKGLEVGDQVVIDGVDRLRDGAKIRRPSGGGRGAPGTPGPPVAAAPPDGGPAAASDASPPERPRRATGERQGANGERRGATGGGRPAQTNQ